MTFLRLCKYIVLGLLGLIFLVVGGYLAINASDDTLSPDAQKLLAAAAQFQPRTISANIVCCQKGHHIKMAMP